MVAKKNEGAIVIAPEKVSEIVEITGWRPSQIRTLKEQVAKDCTDEEFLLFAEVCKSTGLSPFKRQIYAIGRWDKDLGRNKMSVQTGIDGYRTIASRTGLYAGSDAAKFDEGLSLFECLRAGRKQPTVASVTVWKIVQGHRVAFTAECAWEELYPGDKMGFMWRSKPYLMLGKACEAQALRKAFPDKLGDLEIGEPQPEFAGSTAPIDFYETNEWQTALSYFAKAANADEVNKVCEWCNKQIARSKLPQIAAASIDREMEAAMERILSAPPQQKPIEVAVTVEEF